MIKLYSIEIDECQDCPNYRYQSGMMEHSWCNGRGREILVSELSEDPHFPNWCPLVTKDV